MRIYFWPVGVVGLVLAGLVAAIMSSVDSTLNSASALVTLDFVKKFRPDLTPRQTAWVGRLVIVVFMIFAAAFAPIIGSFEGLFDYLQSALAYLVPPVVAIFILGIFWKRANASGAFFSLIGGHSISLGIFVGSRMEAINLHFTIVAGLLFFVTLVLFAVLSRFGEPPSAAVVKELVYDPSAATLEEAVAWYQDFRVQSGILLALTALLVITFW